ncbi:MAG: sulfotransferase family 2 domain-containing protein, partial [Proteobacteria bacterium]|nr:sulfotransferase family 2 domain-containing protein [Pseudomonadota bacterium]
MIISHGRKYIFVHIPKTGGTSLSLALEAKAMKDDILIGDTPKALNRRNRTKGIEASGRLWKHSRLTDIYGPVTQKQIESYFVFTIVRNPWDRMVSYYHWLKAQTFDHPAVRGAHQHCFTDFISDLATLKSLQNDASLDYVSDRNGVDRCDFYLRAESLQQDTKSLEQRLEMKL